MRVVLGPTLRVPEGESVGEVVVVGVPPPPPPLVGDTEGEVVGVAVLALPPPTPPILGVGRGDREALGEGVPDRVCDQGERDEEAQGEGEGDRVPDTELEGEGVSLRVATGGEGVVVGVECRAGVLVPPPPPVFMPPLPSPGVDVAVREKEGEGVEECVPPPRSSPAAPPTNTS